MKIDINKKYRTKDGRAVTLTTTNANDGIDYPVEGVITSPVVHSWTSEGFSLFKGFDLDTDLVEVTE